MAEIQIRYAAIIAMMCFAMLPFRSFALDNVQSGAAGQENAVQSRMTVQEYVTALDSQKSTALTREMVKLSDRAKLNKKMTVDEMTAFICSTPFQTKMVYSFTKDPEGKMTPLEYTHFLADDLFKRKALAPLVNKEQKSGLLIRLKLMDMANSGEKFSAEELAAVTGGFKYVKNE